MKCVKQDWTAATELNPRVLTVDYKLFQAFIWHGNAQIAKLYSPSKYGQVQEQTECVETG